MNLVDRAKNMIVTPKTEWNVVAAEATPQAELITGYVLPLAGLSAIAGFIGSAVIGVGGVFRLSIMTALGLALWQIVAAVIGCFVIGFIIDALAPTFGGQKSSLQAFKVAVYAYTSSWVAGLFQIIPFLGTLIMLIGGLYSIYLLYLGLPKLMKSPEDKSIAYTLVVIVCAIVVSFVIMAIGGMFITAGMVGRGMFGGVPGGAVQAQLDPNTPLGKLEQIGQKLDESAKKMDAAQKSGDGNAQVAAALEGLGALLGGGRRVEPLETDQLKAFVPETLGGFPRTSSRAERSGVAGLMVAKAEADYGDAQKAIALEVTDTGGVSGLVGLASWAGVMGESEDDNGFERTRKVGDRIVHEKGSKHQGGTNEFGIVLGNRFVVSAKSSSVSLDDLKAAVAAMDLGKLEVLKDANVK